LWSRFLIKLSLSLWKRGTERERKEREEREGARARKSLSPEIESEKVV
jgi:hypothetical protein